MNAQSLHDVGFPGIWRNRDAGRLTTPLAHFDSSPGSITCIICAHGIDVRKSSHWDEQEAIPKALRGLHLRWAGEADSVCLFSFHRTLECPQPARDIPFPELNLVIRGVPDSPWQRATRAAAVWRKVQRQSSTCGNKRNYQWQSPQ